MPPVHSPVAIQKPNIHIDRIRITAPCTHKPTGKIIYFDEEDLGELLPGAATANMMVLKDGGGQAYVKSKEIDPLTGKATMLEIHCCPPLLLQKHNLFGHCDLQAYVFTILNLLAIRLGIDVDPFDRDQWRTGGVSITEIHLTGNFRCHESDILPIIQAIDENKLAGKHRDIESCISLGFKERRSTHQVLTVYAKALELKRKWKKPGRYQTMLIEEARKGIRAEVKLYSQGLKLRNLGYVCRWKNIDVAALFFEIFNKFGVIYSIQRALTHHELDALTKAEQKAYRLWLAGIDINDQVSRTTAWKLKKSIFNTTGADIGGKRRPVKEPALDLRDVFKPENVLPIPTWLNGTPFYAPPTYRGHGISSIYVDLPLRR